MDIGFVWDEIKYRTVVKEHDVHFYEVVAAFDDPAGFETIDEVVLHETRLIWVGKPPGNRLLFIVFTEQDLSLYRIVTAYDAEGRWIDEYYGK
jgi:uncharacterized DUF497 family protein